MFQPGGGSSAEETAGYFRIREKTAEAGGRKPGRNMADYDRKSLSDQAQAA